MRESMMTDSMDNTRRSVIPAFPFTGSTRSRSPVMAMLLAGFLLQVPVVASSMEGPGPHPRHAPERAESDDPAYALYREGYHRILQEQWGEAREVFTELRQRYPASSFRDEADYWTAFSWRQENPARAREAYEAFIRAHPASAYLGDAIADLRALEIDAALAGVPQPPPSITPPGEEFRIRLPEELRRIEREMQRMFRTQSDVWRKQMIIIREGDTLLARAPVAPMRVRVYAPEAADPELQVRINALAALMEGKHDAGTFATLRDIAVDGRQPLALRHVALNALSALGGNEQSAVFLQIADHDTSEAIQRVAIELFARSNQPRVNKSERLIGLFHRFEKSSPRREGVLSTTLYALASVGDDRATDFLAVIARSGQESALRSDAIYYLGNLGTDRARQVLLKIVRGE